MSHYCSECHVYWWPYQTPGGCCPDCGSGTTRSNEACTDTSRIRHTNGLDARRSRELHEQFEAYYAEREARRTQAA
jgi:hypothetical protein